MDQYTRHDHAQNSPWNNKVLYGPQARAVWHSVDMAWTSIHWNTPSWDMTGYSVDQCSRYNPVLSTAETVQGTRLCTDPWVLPVWI